MRKLIGFLSLLIAFYLLFVSISSALSSSQKYRKIINEPLISTTPNASTLFDLVNKWRVESGLSAYIKDDRLCAIAKERSDDTPILDNHEGFYTKYNNMNYPWIMQENLSSISSNELVLKGWLNSPSHRAALEKPYTHSCIACDKQCVQIFSSFSR